MEKHTHFYTQDIHTTAKEHTQMIHRYTHSTLIHLKHKYTYWNTHTRIKQMEKLEHTTHTYTQYPPQRRAPQHRRTGWWVGRAPTPPCPKASPRSLAPESCTRCPPGASLPRSSRPERGSGRKEGSKEGRWGSLLLVITIVNHDERPY